ncbi:hypothetical protein LCGC14_0302570, partial [marine sediment metagenome]
MKPRQITLLITYLWLGFTASAGAGVSDRNAALIQAAKAGNVQGVRASLTGGADTNARDQNGIPVLMWAANNGHAEVVKFLLAKDAEVDVKDTDGVTPLWMASQEGHTEVVKLLLAKGAEVDV